VQEYTVGAPNIDWEDIATDGEGHLYLGEIGNNKELLPVRVIYRLDEPDPNQPPAADGERTRLKVTGVWSYRFPDGKRFDAEGLFIDGRRAVVVAKTHDQREAELFAIALDAPAHLVRPVLPTRIGTLPEFREPATGAALAPDGLRLAVCSDTAARVYARPARDSDVWTLQGTVRYESDDIEAITWENDDLILAGERRGIYRIAAATWRAGRPQSP
jgi:hypothetical protein